MRGFTEDELREELAENPDPRCDCIHPAKYHDPVTGACLRTNPVYGPCPCRATKDATRAALEAVHESHKRYAAGGEIAYGSI